MEKIKLENIICAVLKKYDGHMYNSTLTKFIYLIDITNSYNTGWQLINVKWIKEKYGPFSWDIIRTVEKFPTLFNIQYDAATNTKHIFLKDNTLTIDTAISNLISEIAAKVPNPHNEIDAFVEY
ncbi:MAG: hypothetical protein L3V56_13470, partial [Candidatus Magnetoovum sp. WYHC-5]|nr:hypothetical protein [Candidatus Magnetoovum sp. WYHC-5]